MLSKVSILSLRYATSLVMVGEEQTVLEKITEDMTCLKKMLKDSLDLRHFILNPITTRENQKTVILTLAEKSQFETLTKNFLGVVALNGRLSKLSGIIDAFFHVLSQKRGEIKAHITSAIPLDDGRVGAIIQAVKNAVKKDVIFDVTVDPTLIGGFTVHYGSHMVDASLKTQLQHLTFALKGDG